MKISFERSAVNYDDLVPLTLIRSHVRALDDTEDTELQAYREAAVDFLQQQTNRLLGEGTATIILDRHELERTVRLSGINDITAVTSVQYLDNTASYLTLDSAEYRIHTDYPGTFKLKDTLPADAEDDYDESLVKIVVAAGAPLTGLSKKYQQAVLLLCAHWFDTRSAEIIGAPTNEVKLGVARLIGAARQY